MRGEATDACELRLVGTAAGPLAGDDLALSLALRAGARATLRAAGASVAQGGGGGRTLAIRAELGDGADLIAEPGTLVVCAGQPGGGPGRGGARRGRGGGLAGADRARADRGARGAGDAALGRHPLR